MTVIWELDFYSRPVLDENNKKLWEVLICETPLHIDTPLDALFRFSKFCSNTEVNSVWLKAALEEAIAQAPHPPDRVRFFRQQMNNMIKKACDDAGIPANPSRRTLALHQWIQDRMDTVYPDLPNYQPGSNPSVSLEAGTPQPLPDALLGQQWAFVTLEASAFADMPEWEVSFGESFPLELVALAPETRIPGFIIFSSRSLPMAGWMSGLEMAFLRYDSNRQPQLILETGVSDSWVVANLPSPTLQQEAQNFEMAKHKAQNVHFLAIQADPTAESFAGFWMMREMSLA